MIGSSMHNAKLAARIRVRIAMMVHTDKLRYVQVMTLTCYYFSVYVGRMAAQPNIGGAPSAKVQ